MDWITGIQKSLDYIEAHLTDAISYEAAARESASSAFHFQRMFSMLTGYTLGEYIRMRRLSLAADELHGTDDKVIDIALKYGYDTPESFSRAFTRFHGITPTQARRGCNIKSFSALSVKLILEGGNLMDYRIEKRGAFKVLEKVESVSVDDEISKNTIPDFWTRSLKDGTMRELCKHVNENKQLYGICYDNTSKDAKEFEYAIAADYDGGEIPDGFRVSEIPENTWAVFYAVGAMPDAIQNMWHRIFAEYFPASEYKPKGEIDIEVYPDGDMNSADYKSEIWVAVTK